MLAVGAGLMARTFIRLMAEVSTKLVAPGEASVPSAITVRWLAEPPPVLAVKSRSDVPTGLPLLELQPEPDDDGPEGTSLRDPAA